MSNDFLTKSGLLQRGWTNTLITKFCPSPCQTKGNPRYRSAAPMKLYSITRIETIEKTTAFQAAKHKASGRKQAAQKAVETKTAKTMAYVNGVKIKVPRLSKEKLIERACDSYNQRMMDRVDCDSFASKNSNQDFLERICVNHLRHCLTKYEDHLDRIAGKVGTEDAYLSLKEKVLDAIAEAYPWLSEECHRQWNRMYDELMMVR